MGNAGTVTDIRVFLLSVCIRDASEAFSVKPRFPDQLVYLTLDVKDTEDQNLITLFPG
jgi:serine/threonine/tyrosine-interacting protein